MDILMQEDKKTCITCYSCEKELALTLGGRIIRQEECPYCYASVHSCRMCDFYDPKLYNECRESEAERITDKEKANYCSFFVLSGGINLKKQEDQDVLSAANALFKK